MSESISYSGCRAR